MEIPLLSVIDYTCTRILWGASTDVSVDISVDARPTIGRYLIEYRSIYWLGIDRCINRYSYGLIYLAIHRYLTDT